MKGLKIFRHGWSLKDRKKNIQTEPSKSWNEADVEDDVPEVIETENGRSCDTEGGTGCPAQCKIKLLSPELGSAELISSLGVGCVARPRAWLSHAGLVAWLKVLLGEPEHAYLVADRPQPSHTPQNIAGSVDDGEEKVDLGVADTRCGRVIGFGRGFSLISMTRLGLFFTQRLDRALSDSYFAEAG
ncbi:hypothetical protein U1Q18_029340 [Sarracenia purpurea var. burkii]